jgi:hypothetical protein
VTPIGEPAFGGAVDRISTGALEMRSSAGRRKRASFVTNEGGRAGGILSRKAAWESIGARTLQPIPRRSRLLRTQTCSKDREEAEEKNDTGSEFVRLEVDSLREDPSCLASYKVAHPAGRYPRYREIDSPPCSPFEITRQ